MAEHHVNVNWQPAGEAFTVPTFTRDHTVRYPGGVTVNGSAPAAYQGNDALPNPEETFLAAIGTCQMLTFLGMAAGRKFTVEKYEAKITGLIEKNEKGRLCVASVILEPVVAFSGDKQPTPEQLQDLHHKAHDYCIIANSITCKMEIKA